MKKLPIYISLLFILTCAKEDSQAPNLPPTQIAKQYTLTASAGDGGSVTGGGTFASGTQVSVTATPTSGYSFSGWSNGSTANPLTVTLNSNTSITANFQVIADSYTLTVTAGEGGSVSTEGGEYEEGTEVTVTATSEEGYEFIGWSDGDTATERVITISGNTNLNAEYKLIFKKYSIQVDHPLRDEIITNLSITAKSNIIKDLGGSLVMVSHPANGRAAEESLLPTIHLAKIGNGDWEIKRYYDIYMSFGGRSVKKFGEDGYVYADTGTEVWLGGGSGTPYNNVWVAKNISVDNIDWIKVNEHRSFYHGVSSGDLNYDGLEDVVAIHMGTLAEDEKNKIFYHVFFQNEDGSFAQNYDTMKFFIDKKTSSWCYSQPNIDISNCTGVVRGSVLIEDVNNDQKKEIIGGAYIHNPSWNTPEEVHNSLEIFTDYNSSSEYEKLDWVPRLGWHEFSGMGIAGIWSDDYDGDGDLDLLLDYEGSLSENVVDSATFNGMQILDNDGNGNFSLSNTQIGFDDIRVNGWDLLDIDGDGDKDIVFKSNTRIDLGTDQFGLDNSFFYSDNNRFYDSLIVNEDDDAWYDAILNFDELIYINEGGYYVKSNKSNKVIIKKAKPVVGSGWNGEGLLTINSTMVDNNLVFFIYKNSIEDSQIELELIEYYPDTDY
ncbi:hypothetical protein OAT98_01060 [Flavobacteriaceae bacterium]|nr:hypothetical protein [Flavobacteriaceae bacterium]MDC3219161.1 hypothetical protein [Flavobacteriaceae bacterium]